MFPSAGSNYQDTHVSRITGTKPAPATPPEQHSAGATVHPSNNAGRGANRGRNPELCGRMVM